MNPGRASVSSASHVSNLWEKITIKRHSKIASVEMVLLELLLSHSEREDEGKEGRRLRAFTNALAIFRKTRLFQVNAFEK